jgi:Rhodopirellula transposase DDE domain
MLPSCQYRSETPQREAPRYARRSTKRRTSIEYFNKKAASFLTNLQPVISVDTKKNEVVGNFKNGGREWRPKGTPKKSMCTTSLIPS